MQTLSHSPRLRPWMVPFACTLCASLAVAAAGWFLPHQSIWVDETTQLTGIGLGPWRVVRWLTGHELIPRVAADRSPPLSYWVGQGWATVFGTDITAMRWLSVACVGAATWMVCAAASRLFGIAAGLVAGTLFALSPNVISVGVEIRSYALFLLAASMSFYALSRYLTALTPKTAMRWVGVISCCCVAAAYVHFFGVLLAGSLFGAMLIERWRSGKPLRPFVFAGSQPQLRVQGLGRSSSPQ